LCQVGGSVAGSGLFVRFFLGDSGEFGLGLGWASFDGASVRVYFAVQEVIVSSMDLAAS